VAGQIVRSEDFTQTPSQGIWSLGTFEHGTGSISSGSYHLAVDDGWVQLSRLGGAFGDFTASTQLTTAANDPDGSAGIVFRFVDYDNYYLALVDGHQSAVLRKRVAGQWSVVANCRMSQAIRAAGLQNTIEVQAVGSQLSVSVNGTQVLSGVDATFPTGDVGLVACECSAAFANLAVSAITPKRTCRAIITVANVRVASNPGIGDEWSFFVMDGSGTWQQAYSGTTLPAFALGSTDAFAVQVKAVEDDPSSDDVGTATLQFSANCASARAEGETQTANVRVLETSGRGAGQVAVVEFTIRVTLVP
jgi:hypothetical protein